MARGEWKVIVQGQVEFKRKLEQTAADIYGSEMKGAFLSACILVERDAKLLAPVDTGALKTSITSEVRMEPGVTGSGKILGIVGSNKEHAPAQELGTGTFIGKAPHRVPPAELETWARRHGFRNGLIVSMAIYRAGGIRPKRFLQTAFEKNQTAIQDKIGQAVTKIVQK